MKLQDTILTAFQGLNERKFRLALNILGILIGCAAVTGLISITQGLTIEVSSQLDMFGPTNIMVIPYEIRQGRGLIGDSFNWRDVQIMERLPNVKYIAPIVSSQYASYTIRGKTYTAAIFGVTPVYFEIFNSFKIEDGRKLIQSDTGSVVIGHLLAQPNNDEDPILEVGDRITLNFYVGGEPRQATFRIIGILEEIGGTFGSEDDKSLMMPFRDAQTAFETGSKVDFVSIQVNKMENIDTVVEDIKDKFDNKIMVMSYDQIQQQVDQVLGTIEAVLGGIAAISLLVAGVSIVNTMTISVMERTREIGILKAIGSKSNEILLLFIAEATITGLVGGILGAIVGFTAGILVGNYIGLPVSTSTSLGLLVVGFAVITSVLAGLYPSWQAANLHPVEALRYE
ncbi:ABC transporter permease [Candidatus Bathyarchaeota archaeon]|nr:ABC transporter permease [Candidatus Bathyarchaeota archaeon]